MARRGMLCVVLIAVLAATAPAASAEPLPCTDAFVASVEEFLGSLRALGLTRGPATALEELALNAIAAAQDGDLPLALQMLDVLEQLVEGLVGSGTLDAGSGEALLGQLAQARSALTSCTATPPLVAFTCRSGDAENELLWLSPAADYTATTILFRTDRYPEGPNDPVATTLGTFAGLPGEVGRTTHTSLANGERVYYAAYADDGSGELSPGRLTFGRPQDGAAGFRWSHTVGGTGRPSVGGSFDRLATASSAGFVFGLEVGDGGGSWAPEWPPSRVPQPAPSRPISLFPPLVPEPLVLVTSLEGRLVALDGQTGVERWSSPPLGAELRASVCAYLTEPERVLMVGTADPSGPNRFYGLSISDGSVIWSFDNGGGLGALGPIALGCSVDYARRRVYFTTGRPRFGSRDTVFALEFGGGVARKVWSVPVPAVGTSPVLRGEALYVGTSLGEVYALDVVDGSERWAAPWSTGDGAVKDFVFPDRGSTKLAFSTAGRVHLIRDDGVTAAAVWTDPVALPDPNVPLLLGNRVIVAAADGVVYDLDATAPAPALEVFGVFGEPSEPRSPGLPYFDLRFDLYTVGTQEGVLYSVQKPD